MGKPRTLFRKKRKCDTGLAKYLYLSDKELFYRLITSPGSPPLDSRLESFYGALESLRSARSSAWTTYLIFLSAALLSKLNLISDLNTAGISLAPIAFKHVLLIGYSGSMLHVSLISSKWNYISGIFEQRFYASSASKRAELLARFPLAFDTLKYYPTQIGALPLTAAMRTPKRMSAILLFLIIGVVVFFVFSAWLFVTLAIDVWWSHTPLPRGWSWATVFAAGALALVSWLLPTDMIVKRSYMHIGLVSMMNAAHDGDHPRYLRYLAWTNRLLGNKSKL